jgi:hypothetical protein
MTFSLDHWAPYLDENARRTIETFVNDSAAGIKRKQALYLYGTGCNGKSTLIEQVRDFLGEDNFKYVALNSKDGRPRKDGIQPAKLHVVMLEGDNDGSNWIPQFLDLKGVNYREMFKNPVEFVPGNVMVHSNILPSNNQDSFQVVEFKHRFTT